MKAAVLATPQGSSKLDVDAAHLAEPQVAPRRRGWGLYRHGLKRAFDVAAVLLAAPALVPVMAALAVTAAKDGGSPFYTQMRVGRGGRVFRMWKLRTMVPGADAMLEAYLAENPAARAEWDATQKLEEDPRVTAAGRFLRRSSLDELPQLWNVLRGDMSLVGPRPMLPAQQVLYPGTAYYKLRPGVTGFWQIAGRSRTTFEARADFDADYDAQLSLAVDLKVLLKTVAVVLIGTGV